MSRIFILGAGFSKPAGLPLGNELFKEVIDSAKLNRNDYDILKEDIDDFLDYYIGTKNISISEEDINFEEFISYLDIEFYLGLYGSKTWNYEGNRSQIIIRNHLAKILYEKSVDINNDNMELYIEFAKRLKENDIIITFNYDTLIENALDSIKSTYKFHSMSELPGNIVLLKMHGSIDWFNIESYEKSYKYFRESPFFQLPKHKIFSDEKVFNPKKIISFSEDKDNPLHNIYKIDNLDKYFTKSNFVTESPFIISPSFNKQFYLNILKDLWYGFYGAGNCEGVAIIGFSMAEHDDYIKLPLYYLISQFQDLEQKERLWPKTNLKIVDYRKSEKERADFKSIYSFVNWDETDYYFDGFDNNAIEIIFN